MASPAGCAALSTAVLGMDITGLPHRVIADAMGELLNMLGGGVKRRLPGGGELELGLPLFVNGGIEPSGRQTVVTVPLKLGPIEVCVIVVGPNG
jgi:CheY-specific phosphatase CheX